MKKPNQKSQALHSKKRTRAKAKAKPKGNPKVQSIVVKFYEKAGPDDKIFGTGSPLVGSEVRGEDRYAARQKAISYFANQASDQSIAEIVAQTKRKLSDYTHEWIRKVDNDSDALHSGLDRIAGFLRNYWCLGCTRKAIILILKSSDSVGVHLDKEKGAVWFSNELFSELIDFAMEYFNEESETDDDHPIVGIDTKWTWDELEDALLVIR